MQENNMFEKSDNFENTQPINDNFENLTSDESDIKLDPELTSDSAQNTEQPNSYYENYEEPQIEPIAPIMPQINKNPYEPVDKTNSSKGIKVFAVVLALLIIISASVTSGYYLGTNTNKNNVVTVDLASKPSPENALTTSQIFNNVSPSVVGICVYSLEDEHVYSATGVIYSKDGYIITNDHIYANTPAAKFKIYTHDNKMYSATYIAGDTRTDLAVLKITDAANVTFKPATLGDSSQVVVGESVIAIGRPNGAANSSIVSEGVISTNSVRVSITSSYTNNLLQTDCAINPGSSGGALCNIYGQVIGITSAKLDGDGDDDESSDNTSPEHDIDYEGVGYAIPTTTVKKVVDSLIKYKIVKNRAKLGISYVFIDELTAELSNLPCGLLIGEIDKSSDLYGKSVEIKDIITHVNSTKISDVNVLLNIIENRVAGDTLNLTIYSYKNKKSFDINVKLLADEGESSYTLKKQENNTSNNDNSGNNYNSEEFNFPNGE